MGSPFLYLCHSGQEMLLLGRSPLLPSTLISLTLLLPMVVILDTSTIDSTTWGSTVQVSRLCYDCVVVEPSEDDNSEDLVGSYRLLNGGNHSECSDSCVYVKDGGPPDEMWCFKTEQTEQNETFYNANNQCPESTIATLATALSGSTSTVSPTIVSTTARVGTSTITQKIRSSTLMSTITKGTDVTSTTADQTKITGTKLSTKDTPASLAHSVHGLAHSLCSLPRGTVVIHRTVFMLRSRSKETNAIVAVTRNTPSIAVLWKKKFIFSFLII